MAESIYIDACGSILWMRGGEIPTQLEPVLLALQAKTGNHAAFDRLMELEQARVSRMARRLLTQSDDAADAVQEVFLRLYRHLQKFDPAQQWDAWVYRICANVCRDLNRKRRWRSMLSLDDWLSAGGSAPLAPSRADDQTFQRERRQAIADGLRRLPEKERLALVLRDVEGLSAGEAAKVLGTREATVRSQASRARSRMREFLITRLDGRGL